MNALMQVVRTNQQALTEMNERASQSSLTAADAETLLAMVNELLRRLPDALSANKKPTGNHRIPEDWVPSPKVLEWATENCPNLDLQEEAEKFEIHYQSVGGSRGLRKDWNLAFKSWLLNARKFASERAARNPTKQTREDKRAEITRATIREDADDPF